MFFLNASIYVVYIGLLIMSTKIGLQLFDSDFFLRFTALE